MEAATPGGEKAASEGMSKKGKSQDWALSVNTRRKERLRIILGYGGEGDPEGKKTTEKRQIDKQRGMSFNTFVESGRRKVLEITSQKRRGKPQAVMEGGFILEVGKRNLQRREFLEKGELGHFYRGSLRKGGQGWTLTADPGTDLF